MNLTMEGYTGDWKDVQYYLVTIMRAIEKSEEDWDYSSPALTSS